MKKLVLINDNTVKDIPQKPIVTYELVADLGEDGTKTIFESEDRLEISMILRGIEDGELPNLNIDLDEDELENIETISVNVVLTAQDLDIITYGDEKSAMAELVSYKVTR